MAADYRASSVQTAQLDRVSGLPFLVIVSYLMLQSFLWEEVGMYFFMRKKSTCTCTEWESALCADEYYWELVGAPCALVYPAEPATASSLASSVLAPTL